MNSSCRLRSRWLAGGLWLLAAAAAVAWPSPVASSTHPEVAPVPSGSDEWFQLADLGPEQRASRCSVAVSLERKDEYSPSFVLAVKGRDTRLYSNATLGQIQEAGFAAGARTTVIVHGFNQGYPRARFVRELRELMITNDKLVEPSASGAQPADKHNLILMDYERVGRASYKEAASLAPLMGSYLAELVAKLLELGADRNSVHIIGHSLGSHVAGFAGKRLRPPVGRITGIDPAGPCFGRLFEDKSETRLTAGDAQLVDVYHYDDDFVGLHGQHGDLDIMFNGGRDQPGCRNAFGSTFSALAVKLVGKKKVISESHSRSVVVMDTQLSDSDCHIVAYECSDYDAFKAGRCGHCDDLNSQCFMASFDFQYKQPIRPELLRRNPDELPTKRLMFVETGPNKPFCIQHYQLLAQLGTPVDGLRSAQVQLLEHIGQPDVPTINIANLTPDKLQLSQLLKREGAPVRFAAALVKTSKGPVLRELRVNYMSNIDPQRRRALSSRLCAGPDLEPNAQGWLLLDELSCEPIEA